MKAGRTNPPQAVPLSVVPPNIFVVQQFGQFVADLLTVHLNIQVAGVFPIWLGILSEFTDKNLYLY